MGSIWIEEQIASAVDGSEKIGKLHTTLALISMPGYTEVIFTLKSVFILKICPFLLQVACQQKC